MIFLVSEVCSKVKDAPGGPWRFPQASVSSRRGSQKVFRRLRRPPEAPPKLPEALGEAPSVFPGAWAVTEKAPESFQSGPPRPGAPGGLEIAFFKYKTDKDFSGTNFLVSEVCWKRKDAFGGP